MRIIAVVLFAILALTVSILFVGTKVKVNNDEIKMGFRTYKKEDIMRHQFSVKVRYKSPAEYDAELGAFIPRAGAPPSHRKKWAVEFKVFDSNGQFVRKHLLQKPNEAAAEKLAAELHHSLASQLIEEN